jgi:UDP-2-acetamido-3-amino-2,3-dideoxy-glucuronate N-acetyltransferase
MTARHIAVVGCGYWGKNLVRNFAALDALAAVVDPRPAVAGQLASEFGAPARSFEEALGDASIAGVAIAAPAELHADLAIRALRAGKHVFVEKPLALTMKDGRAIAAAGEAAGRIVMVGHLLQYHPAFEKLLAVVRAGELGVLRYAYSHRLSLGKFRTEESALWSFAPHDVSMLLALFGEEPAEVSADGGAYVTAGVEDACRLDMSFPDGRRAHVFASWLHPFKEHRLVVVGSKAMAVFEDSAQGVDKLRLYRHVVDTSGAVPEPKKAEAEPIPYEDGEPLRRECAHFLDCIATGAPARTDAAEALRVLRVMTEAETRPAGNKVRAA